MKAFLVVFSMLISIGLFAQIPTVKKDSCFRKGTARKNQRFAEWECGKIAGVVDCNEKLELDQGTNTVITKSGKKPFSGICETCHSNGLKERIVTFVDGKQNGIDTTYYASGCIMVIRNHVQGAENGKHTYFYDSLGTVAWEMNYSIGQKHGPQVYFTKKKNASQGDTIKYEVYTNGIPNGPKITYEKGKRVKLVTYVNGLFDGPFLVYNSKQKLIEELNYSKGKKNGVFKYYYDDGVLLRTETWTMDVRNGEFKTFFYQGDIQKREFYKKGLKEGTFEEYFFNKKLKVRAIYSKGELVEEHVFNEAGTEIKTFGAEALSDKERDDDEVPTGTEKKKKKKKKEKEPDRQIKAE